MRRAITRGPTIARAVYRSKARAAKARTRMEPLPNILLSLFIVSVIISGCILGWSRAPERGHKGVKYRTPPLR